jgi:hypothetical protein
VKLRLVMVVLGIGTVVSGLLVLAPEVASAAPACTYPAAPCTSPNGGGGGGGDGDGGSPVVPGGPVTKAASGNGSLAFTGADIEQMVGIGTGLVAVGGVFFWRSRRRTASQPS